VTWINRKNGHTSDGDVRRGISARDLRVLRVIDCDHAVASPLDKLTNMKLSFVILLSSIGSSAAFHVSVGASRRLTHLSGFDLSGNSWKPDSEKMGSTDTGDFFPEDYDPNAIDYTAGMMGSQQFLSEDRQRDWNNLPGLENLGEDAIMMGGLEQATEIPAGMDFTPSMRADGEYHMPNVPSSGQSQLTIAVQSPCMTFEDFYAAFSPDSNRAFKVTPATGRMDRRNGEPSEFTIICEPSGQAGNLEGSLVINLPDDNTKMTYKITAYSM